MKGTSMRTPQTWAESPCEDKLPPQTFLIPLLMAVSSHSCFITLPSQREGEESQTLSLLLLASARGKTVQGNKSSHISPSSCKILQGTREAVWHLPLQWSHKV